MMAFALLIALFLPSAPPAADYIEADPLVISREPDQFVGVPIKLKCRFIRLDDTWLNDRDVFRSSDDQIGFIVEASDRIFAQLFFPRSREEEIKRFEKSDRLLVYGKVISAKNNFPWIDVEKVSEGWVIGEEPEAVRSQRIETARNYADFLKGRQELGAEDLRAWSHRQEALIQILIDKGVFSREEWEAAVSRSSAPPTPAPPWEKILQGK
jgi:hypothetical protein